MSNKSRKEKVLKTGIACDLEYACDACPYRKACDEGDIGTIQKSEAQKRLNRAIENFCKIFNAEITIKITLKGTDERKKNGHKD